MLRAHASPGLRQPPPLTPQGTIVQPEPEKSFIQKYWIYIAVVLVALGAFPPPFATPLGSATLNTAYVCFSRGDSGGAWGGRAGEGGRGPDRRCRTLSWRPHWLEALGPIARRCRGFFLFVCRPGQWLENPMFSTAFLRHGPRPRATRSTGLERASAVRR